MCVSYSRVMHLQQRWQELKEREHIAQQQNRQLLQQFEKAQDTLKGMLARNAAMKVIRVCRCAENRPIKHTGRNLFFPHEALKINYCFDPCRWSMRDTWRRTPPAGSSNLRRRDRQLRRRYK